MKSTSITEASLSRVWQHFNDPDRSVAILTAFRGEYDYDDNVKRNQSLTAKIRKLGYGFIFVDGYWVENPGTEDEVRVKEDSVFVVAPAAAPNFAQEIHDLGNSFQQEAVVVKDQQGTRLIFADGSTQPLGTIKPGSLGNIYTQLRTGKQSSTFVFEAERDDIGWIKRLAGVKTVDK